MAKTVVFDFDGVIHSYTSGWQGEDTILDPPVPGIREALKEIRDAGYEVVVVSTRCATIKGHGAIEAWLYDNGLREYIDKVCKEKPPAVAYIDDRAICFDGHPETLLKKIKNFQPWYKKPTITPPNEWVSVEDAMPPEHEPVLCIVDGKPKPNITLEDAYQIGSWNKADGWIIDEYLDWEDADVSWWMPLPAPPDKDNNVLTKTPNEPLTLDELREMDGPVWVACKPIEGGNGYWCLCKRGNIVTQAGSVFDMKEIPHWVFYRRPPEGETDA